jgi:hypothetical protein
MHLDRRLMTMTPRLALLLLLIFSMSLPAQTVESTEVDIAAVETLQDYAAVMRVLSRVSGVKRVEVTAADGARLTFRVQVPGGRAALQSGLSGVTELSAVAGDRLLYQYKR